MVTEQELLEIERVLERSTPGLWVPMIKQIGLLVEGEYQYQFDPTQKQADIDFICTARRDIPKLIAAIRELREHLSPKVSP